MSIGTPDGTSDTCQFFTKADRAKLRGIGYGSPFTPLEEGVAECVGKHPAGRGLKERNDGG